MRTIFASILSLVWIAANLYGVYLKSANIPNMPLNEWGSFLSGSISGLALIWLIVVYFQQNADLKINNETLKAQKEEMGNQVKESRRLATNAEEQLKLHYKVSIQPSLVFYNKGKDNNDKNRWMVKNVGNGPAINVTVASGKTDEKWIQNESLLLSALAPNDERYLFWTKHHGALMATYSDIEDRHYTSKCKNNRNELHEGNKYPEVKATKFEYQFPEVKIDQNVTGIT